MTPPGVMGPDYGSPYPYQAYPTNYPHFSGGQGPMQPGMMPPTPTGQHPSHHHHPQQQQQQHNGSSYMVPSMTSDPSSSETSSPDLYNGEFAILNINNPNCPILIIITMA
ncbi:hypothetical protein G6F42_028241 [Rhizopus arrhizus]|nr:hypothetical protein G6F42_028241 [Rhizopus arrhizus]